MFPLFLFLIFDFSFFSCGDCGNQTALFIFCEKDGSAIEKYNGFDVKKN